MACTSATSRCTATRVSTPGLTLTSRLLYWYMRAGLSESMAQLCRLLAISHLACTLVQAREANYEVVLAV